MGVGGTDITSDVLGIVGNVLLLVKDEIDDDGWNDCVEVDGLDD